MIKDDGIRSIYQMQGEGPDGSIKNLKTNEKGELIVVSSKGGAITSNEKVLMSGNIVLGTEEQVIDVNANVTSIMAANYAESADVVMEVGEQSILVGANIATEFPINEEVTTITLSATAAETKLYYIIKENRTEGV